MVPISKSAWQGPAGEERCESGVGFVRRSHTVRRAFDKCAGKPAEGRRHKSHTGTAFFSSPPSRMFCFQIL